MTLIQEATAVNSANTETTEFKRTGKSDFNLPIDFDEHFDAELVNVDRSHISAIELGKVGVSFDVIFKLCEVLEITPKELFDFR